MAFQLWFSGDVQGVGFRATAADTARDLGLCGWARNHRDGRVEIVVGGEQETIEDFIDRLQALFRADYQCQRINDESVESDSDEFRIRY